MLTQGEFSKITDVVINNFEGGYFHPAMLADGRVKDSRYASSGETMFGIDRKNGGDINTSDAGRQFWSIIDNADARSKWAWNYKGGSLENKLRSLAADMIRPEYDELLQKYLTTKAQKLVNSDPRLVMHFIYATWNGAGWFKKFATDINDAIDKGITNTDKLTKIAIDSRTKEGISSGSSPNSLIAQSGNKMIDLFEELGVTPKGILIGILALAGIGIALTLLIVNKSEIESI